MLCGAGRNYLAFFTRGMLGTDQKQAATKVAAVGTRALRPGPENSPVLLLSDWQSLANWYTVKPVGEQGSDAGVDSLERR